MSKVGVTDALCLAKAGGGGVPDGLCLINVGVRVCVCEWGGGGG